MYIQNNLHPLHGKLLSLHAPSQENLHLRKLENRQQRKIPRRSTDKSTRMLLRGDTKIFQLRERESVLQSTPLALVTMSPLQLGIESLRFTPKSHPAKSAQGTKKDVACQKSKGHVVFLMMQGPHKEGFPAQSEGGGRGGLKKTAVGVALITREVKVDCWSARLHVLPISLLLGPLPMLAPTKATYAIQQGNQPAKNRG